jgi:hypothetical protein
MSAEMCRDFGGEQGKTLMKITKVLRMALEKVEAIRRGKLGYPDGDPDGENAGREWHLAAGKLVTVMQALVDALDGMATFGECSRHTDDLWDALERLDVSELEDVVFNLEDLP